MRSIVGLFFALALVVPATAAAEAIPGATYEGTVSGGGKVRFHVSVDGKFVTSFRAEEVPGTLCEVEYIESTPSSGDGYPISGGSFSSFPLDFQFKFEGSFPGYQRATGTLGVFTSCITGTKSWTASTTATPPPPEPPRDRTPPALSLHYKHTQPAVRKRAIELAVACPTEACRVDAEAFVSLSNADIYDLGSKRLYLVVGAAGKLRFKMTKNALAAVRRAHREGRRRVEANVRVEARDDEPLFNRTERFLKLWVK